MAVQLQHGQSSLFFSFFFERLLASQIEPPSFLPSYCQGTGSIVDESMDAPSPLLGSINSMDTISPYGPAPFAMTIPETYGD
jgi:hypothetical protein